MSTVIPNNKNWRRFATHCDKLARNLHAAAIPRHGHHLVDRIEARA